MKRGTYWTFTAPPDAAKLHARCDGVVAVVNVEDSYAVLDAATTAKFPGGSVCQTEWELESGGVMDGPRFNVRGSIAHGDQVRQTFAEQMVAKLEQTLLTMAGDGATSVSLPDGQSVSFEDREAIRMELARWKEQVRVERGTRREFTTLRLSGIT